MLHGNLEVSGNHTGVCVYILYMYAYNMYIQDIGKNFEFEKGSRDRNKK